MDTHTLSVLIGITIFFLLLHVVVLPVFRHISIAVQGEPFTYRLQVWMKSQASENVAKWDILWSAASLLVAMAATLGILVGLTQVGVIPE